MATNATGTDITEESEEYRLRLPQWRKVRDALEGEERVHERGTEYLPKPSGMRDLRKYTSYRDRASFFDIADATLEGLEGLVFRVEPTFELPTAIESMLDVATSRGFDMLMLAHETVREVISLGRFGLWLDLPAEATIGPPTPRISCYFAEDIFRWEERIIQGERVLWRVVLRDEPTTSDDVETERLWELFIDVDGYYTVQMWERQQEETRSDGTTPRSDRQLQDGITGDYDPVGEPIKPAIRGNRLERIPFQFINCKDLRPRTQKPPFLKLVNMNLAHYRNSADYEHALHIVAQPTPYFLGISGIDKPKTIGSGTIWTSENAQAKVGMLEFSGAGIDAQAKAMMDKEGRMAVLGAMLIREDESNVTAETVRMKTRGQTSALINAVQSSQAGLENILRLAAEWAGANPDEVTVEFNTDFIETRMSAQEQVALVSGWQQGAYSRQTLHENLQRGEIIPTTRSLEEEVELQEGEDDAGLMPNPGGSVTEESQNEPDGPPPDDTEDEPQPPPAEDE